MYRNGKHMISTFFPFGCCCCCLFFIRSQWHWGLHAPRRRTYLRKTDFYTQRVVDRKRKLPDLWTLTLFKSLPVSSLPTSLGSSLESNQHTHSHTSTHTHTHTQTHTEGSGSGSYGLRSGATNAGPCTESTIPTRGKETQPFGLNTWYYFIQK